jgi:hypothetical protein
VTLRFTLATLRSRDGIRCSSRNLFDRYALFLPCCGARSLQLDFLNIRAANLALICSSSMVVVTGQPPVLGRRRVSGNTDPSSGVSTNHMPVSRSGLGTKISTSAIPLCILRVLLLRNVLLHGANRDGCRLHAGVGPKTTWHNNGLETRKHLRPRHRIQSSQKCGRLRGRRRRRDRSSVCTSCSPRSSLLRVSCLVTGQNR